MDRAARSFQQHDAQALVWLDLTFELELSLDRVSRIHFEAALCSEGSRRQQRTQAYSTALLGHG